MKRAVDMGAALLLLLVLSPVIVFLACLIRTRLGTPVLFRQTRIGWHDQTFDILKFRTMTDDTDSGGKLLDDQFRLTRLGRFLRASSLDELPGLWNVLIGEMSLVGPRPLLPEYLPLYNETQRRRHELRPGITGWAQVNGRNALSWQDRFAHDVWYVDNQSIALDLKILLLTVKKVVAREGISAEGSVTMPKFTGNDD